jgi:hypothetical protein
MTSRTVNPTAPRTLTAALPAAAWRPSPGLVEALARLLRETARRESVPAEK